MTDELKKFLTDNKNLLIRNDFDGLYNNCPPGMWAELSDFLFNVANINPLNYMRGDVGKVFTLNNFKKELVIPKNVNLTEGRIRGISAPSIILQCNLVRYTLSTVTSNKISVESDVTKIPSNFLYAVQAEKVYIPKSVTRIGNDAFKDCSSTIKIITPYRENPQERLIVPKNEIEWYKEHLKFTHAPKEDKEEVKGE